MRNSIHTHTDKTLLFRITAVWAFNEAVLGGILHALKVPFTGLLIGGFASLLITLIALNSDKRGVILKSALIVVIIKGIVAPHTPPAAFFSVAVQALIGEMLFFSKRSFRFSAFALALIAAMVSSFQKIFMLTVIYGTGLWNALDDFAVYITGQLGINSDNLNFPAFSTILISGYLLIHLAGGIFFGSLSAVLPRKLNLWADKYADNLTRHDSVYESVPADKKKRFKITRHLVFLFIVLFAAVSYFDSSLNKNNFYGALVMLIRSTAILLLWYFIAAPLLMKALKAVFSRNRLRYQREIETIIGMFPAFRAAFNESMNFIKSIYGFKKITTFISLYLTLILFSKGLDDEADIRTDW